MWNRRLIQAGVAAGVVLTAFVDGGYAPGFFAAAAAVLWWTLLLGIALRVLPRAPQPASAVVVATVLALLVALTGASMLWADDAGLAFEAAVRVAAYAGLFGFVLLCSRKGEVRPWLDGLLAGLLIVAGAALLAHLFPGLLGGDRELQRLLPAARGRLSYPIGYWNGLAACMAIAVVLLGWRSISAVRLHDRLFAIAAMSVPLLVIYLASSRGGFAAALAGTFAMLVFAARRSHLPAIAAAVVGAGVVAALAFGPVGQWETFKQPPRAGVRVEDDFRSTHLVSGSGSGRYQFWSAAVDAFEDEPLRGIGAGGYGTWWYRHGSVAYTLRNAHSVFFTTLAELGAAGALLLTAFLAIPLLCGWRLRDGPRRHEVAACAGVLIAAIVSAGLDWTWQLPAAFGPAILAAALLAGPACSPRGPIRSQVLRRLGRPLAILAGTLALLAAADLYLAQGRLGESRASARAGRIDAAIESAAGAAAIAPWSAAPRLQLALLAERAGRLDLARAELSVAIERAPSDWRLWMVQTRLLLRSGKARPARAALRRARRLYPHSPLLGPVRR